MSENFQKALDSLINMKISLFLSDNQFIEGVLLDVKQDHIVVDVNQNIYYFALQHIQSLSKNAKDFSVSSEIVHYVNKNYLVDVFKAFRYNWVSINSLSDQVLFGVLSTISDDYITVINNSELLYIPKSNLSTLMEFIRRTDYFNKYTATTRNPKIVKLRSKLSVKIHREKRN